ncbi:MAG TPA: tetratricopeptide repeat protein [Candidatus Binatia bacterium]|jgi:predicted Zn-dependent protease|nr:tetratricopeptide repeat protein [Candidatus Binatia bacterium]
MNYSVGVALAVLLMLPACAPQRPYRVPAPPARSTPAPSPVPPPPPAPPPETIVKPLPPDPKIREQDLKPKPLPPDPPAKETARQPGSGATPIPESGALLPTPLPDDSSLLAKITPGVTPQRAASLRLTDEGSKLLDAGEPAKALTRLERTIVIDATNPYGYFYLAKAQHRLGHYQESLNFLGVAESRLSGEPFWLSEVHALRGENYRAQGQLQRAEASYAEALRLNSGNRTAADGLNRLQLETPSANR